MRSIRAIFVSIAVLTFALSSPASASSSVIEDPFGDVAGVPAYLDVVQAKVTDQVGRDRLYFSMELAGALPAVPPDGFLAYNWVVDVNGDGVLDYAVTVRWCTQPAGLLCASTEPLPRWEASVNRFGVGLTFFSSFKVDGANVKAFLDPALIGEPAGFRWQALTRNSAAAGGVPPLDRAPNVGFASFMR